MKIDSDDSFFASVMLNQDSSLITDKTTESIDSLSLNDSTRLDKATLVNFAKTLQGIPYKYGSTNPKNGFDCSGFITYTFNHFNFPVPRSSVDFTNYGSPISFKKALPGDLILFTGTDSTKKVVGHMGILTQTRDSIKFIHSTSGKAYGVTITPLNKYYAGRFVKIIRVLD
ncbi:C40 family peptidase [Pedobacter alpinus]|uniref:C40 family peptidase n=1 Tax=Pedobacter alpinus TaxID=1590643 RepID=A0ABW5TPP2_9SPHI